MKRALFFPSYFGSGFGHAQRCLILADELTRRGWLSAFVMAGNHVVSVAKKGYKVYQPQLPMRPRSPGTNQTYTYIVDGNVQLLRDGFFHPLKFFTAVMEVLYVIKRFRPDVLIGDFSLIPWVAGRRANLPVVQIAQSISYPKEPKIIWWTNAPREAVSPDIRPVVNPVLRWWGIEEVNCLEDLLQGDMYLIPSIPELEPVSAVLPHTHYTGALIKEGNEKEQPSPIRDRAREPLVYVSLGGGASLVSNLAFYLALNEALKDIPCRAIVSTGGKLDPALINQLPDNVSYHQWVNGSAIIRESDVVLFHGGHGTMMETVYSGVPSVIIPFHSEQECNGRRLAAQSAALLLTQDNENKAPHCIHSRWRYGEYITCFRPFNPPSPEVLQDAVSSVLKNRQFRDAACQLSSINESYGGVTYAAEIIDHRYRT